MNEWNIQSRAHACEACTQPFADQQSYHTLLLDDAPLLRRTDICEPCWQKQAAAEARRRTGFISHWQGVYEVPPAQPVEAIQKETAETVLRKLIEQNEPRYAPAAYILAVMLERKRILRPQPSSEKGTLVYEHASTGETFLITDPQLSLSDLASVQEEVSALLSGLTGISSAPPVSEASVPQIATA